MTHWMPKSKKDITKGTSLFTYNFQEDLEGLQKNKNILPKNKSGKTIIILDNALSLEDEKSSKGALKKIYFGKEGLHFEQVFKRYNRRYRKKS